MVCFFETSIASMEKVMLEFLEKGQYPKRRVMMSLITITSGIGCGEMRIAKRVADGLELELYDDQRLQEKAVEMGLSLEDLKGFDEKAPGLFNRLLRRKPEVYLDVLDALIYEIAHQGEGILFGHGAQLLLRDFECALQVRIYSSESSRINYLMNNQNLTHEAAEKMIHKTDNERSGFFQFAYHMDWNEPSLYDLIVNRDKLGEDSAAKLIIEVAQSEVIAACSLSALDSMERMSLLKKVQAAILKNNISPLEFHIEVPEKGMVYITGSLSPFDSESTLLEVLRAVPGVKEVKSELVTPELHDIG
jgi:cytidylate kinase